MPAFERTKLRLKKGYTCEGGNRARYASLSSMRYPLTASSGQITC